MPHVVLWAKSCLHSAKDGGREVAFSSPFRQVAKLIRGQVNLRRIAVDAPPNNRKPNPRRADDQKHPAPTPSQHEERKQWDRDEVAKRRCGLAKATGESPLTYTEPIADDSRSRGKQGCFPHSQRDTRHNEGSKASDQTTSRLRNRPAEES